MVEIEAHSCAHGEQSPLFVHLARSIASVGDEDFAQAFATLLQEASDYHSTVVAAFPASGRPIRLFSNLPPADEETTVRPYFDNTYLLDPWYNMARSGIADGVYRLSECVPDNFRDSEYFMDYYAATGLVDEAGIFVRLTDALCIVAMLGIRDQQAAETNGHLDQLIATLPCLQELVRKHWGGLSSLAITPVENLSALCQAQGLAGREIEVTCHLLRGYSNKLIGRELGISPETVKVYRKRINRKLGTSSTREVFAVFFGKGMYG